MRIKEFEVKGVKYLFVNEAASTRSGFKHTSTLFRNRVWNCYTYLSLLK